MVKPNYQTMLLHHEIENKILAAARNEFEAKGYNGARMQAIADTAGISKASLHYYFRSKDNLFTKIFNDALDEYVPLVSTWADDNLTWEEKVRLFTKSLIAFIKEGRMLFLIREINRNPELLNERIKRAKGHNKFVAHFDGLQQQGVVGNIDTRFLFIFLQSLSFFPFINRLMFAKSLRMTPRQFDEFMEGYAEPMADFFINAIKNK